MTDKTKKSRALAARKWAKANREHKAEIDRKAWQKFKTTKPEMVKQSQDKFAKTDKWKQLVRRRSLKQKYGITLQDKIEMWEVQGKQCAVCRSKLTFEQAHVDHSHITRRVRGILCRGCNFAYGILKEDEERIRNLLSYHLQYKE